MRPRNQSTDAIRYSVELYNRRLSVDKKIRNLFGIQRCDRLSEMRDIYSSRLLPSTQLQCVGRDLFLGGIYYNPYRDLRPPY